MSDIWNRIRQLKGQTIQTVARKRAFTIEQVSDDTVFYSLESTGKQRSSGRDTFEKIVDLGLSQHELTRSRVDAEVSGGDALNSSYVHALLYAVGKAA